MRFRAPGKVEPVIRGFGEDPLSLVTRAEQLRDEAEYRFDQVWCVFDRDDVPAQSFNAAIASAVNKRMKVADSNQAFELWYLLHFQDCSSPMPRQDYMAKLSEALKHPYEKNSETMYAELLDKQETAISRAGRLLERYNPRNPADDDPSTTVHKLVQELNKHGH